MIKRLLVPILKICKSKLIKIEDFLFTNRETEQIGTKLMNWSRQREDFAKVNFRANQEDQERLKRESNEHVEVEKERKFVTEVTPPSEEGILGPSDSESV